MSGTEKVVGGKGGIFKFDDRFSAHARFDGNILVLITRTAQNLEKSAVILAVIRGGKTAVIVEACDMYMFNVFAVFDEALDVLAVIAHMIKIDERANRRKVHGANDAYGIGNGIDDIAFGIIQRLIASTFPYCSVIGAMTSAINCSNSS